MSRGSSERARPPGTAPYTSYRTFRSFIDDLREQGTPSRIDRSVLSRYSGIVGTQLMHALRFLDLIDAEGRTGAALGALVRAEADGRWREALGDLLRRAYAPMFEIDLESATPSQFSDAFRKAFPAADAVVQKCVTFFLYAAADAGVKISSRVLKGRKPRPLTPRRRRSPGAAASGRAAGPPEAPVFLAPALSAAPGEGKKPSEILFVHLDPNTMDEAQQAAVWTLMRYFKAKGL